MSKQHMKDEEVEGARRGMTVYSWLGERWSLHVLLHISVTGLTVWACMVWSTRFNPFGTDYWAEIETTACSLLAFLLIALWWKNSPLAGRILMSFVAIADLALIAQTSSSLAATLAN